MTLDFAGAAARAGRGPAARAGALALLMVAAGCQGPQSALDPHGPGARSIADLWWVMFWLATAVGVVSLGLLGYALFHRRRGERPRSPEADRGPIRWVLIGGAAVPALILLFLFVHTLFTLGALADEGEPAVVVEVTGLQWWWRVRYVGGQPNETFETANEIHVPVGERVQLRLRSEDVIHSFWVPGLQGKMDLVPGRTNTFWIQADSAGVYRGQCAEFCGLQHAHMAFLVVAEPRERFARWQEEQRRPAPAPAAEHADAGAGQAEAGGHHPSPQRGQEVFLGSACSTCHTIRGTAAGGKLGPDLTHLASRRTLAAGTIPNMEGHLAGWIANPQQIKPGALMPRVPLGTEEFHALLHYLQSLR